MNAEKKDLLSSIIIKDDPIVLDIGAHSGKDTVYFLKNFCNSIVYSFEPDKRALKKFKKRAKKYKKFYERNKLFSYAISDVDGVEKFYVTDSSGSSSLREPVESVIESIFPEIRIKEIVKMKTKKLDTWCAENKINEIDCIWSDVQGGEDKMIRGGKESLKKTKILILECMLIEAYKGLFDKTKILELLPDFEIIKEFKGSYQSDIFLRNINYT